MDSIQDNLVSIRKAYVTLISAPLNVQSASEWIETCRLIQKETSIIEQAAMEIINKDTERLAKELNARQT